MLCDRVRMGRQAAQFGRVVKTLDDKTIVQLPGHEAKMHSVIIFKRNNALVVKCDVMAGYQYVPCNNGPKAVCYHCLGAIVLYAEAKGYEISFHKTLLGAKRAAKNHDDGKTVVIADHRGKANLMAAYWSTVQRQPTAKEFPTLMQDAKDAAANMMSLVDEQGAVGMYDEILRVLVEKNDAMLADEGLLSASQESFTVETPHGTKFDPRWIIDSLEDEEWRKQQILSRNASLVDDGKMNSVESDLEQELMDDRDASERNHEKP